MRAQPPQRRRRVSRPAFLPRRNFVTLALNARKTRKARISVDDRSLRAPVVSTCGLSWALVDMLLAGENDLHLADFPRPMRGAVAAGKTGGRPYE